MKKKMIPLVVFILLLISSLAYFGVISKLNNNDKIEGSGTIEVTEIEISSKISGRVSKLPLAEGEKVNKGDLIVKLEYDELSAQQNSARASLVNVEKNLRRIKSLYKSGSISRQDLDNAETAYRVARAAYDQVNATIENALIYSPIDGTVLDSILEEGETAFPGTTILTLANLKKTWIYIYISEKKLGLVKLGQAAYITVDSYPGKKFKGKVVAISNKAEFTPKTIETKEERIKLVFAVKISIDNPDENLKPGMPADAEILYKGGSL